MQGFHFLIKFGLVLIYVSMVYRKKVLFDFIEKKCSIHYLHFSFENHAPSQVLKCFSVENQETTPSTFLSKFSCEIVLLYYT